MQTREWTTEAVPVALRFGYWQRAVCEGVVGAETESPRPGPFYARMATSRAADFGFATFAASGHAVVRTQRHARRDGAAPFLLSLQLRGESRYGESGAEHIIVREGEIAFVNTARPFRVTFPGEVSRVIAILPRPLLRARLPWCGDIGALKVDGTLPAAEPLRAYLAAAGRNLGVLDARTAGAFLDNVANLIALALAPAHGGEGARRARFDALGAFVSRRHADPALAPRHAADALGLSLRQLHRLFAQNGTTFGRFLRERRLDDCRKRLADPAEAARAISDIAFGAGFNELSHFSRAFKARFGESPRRYKAGARADASVRR
jgi:AraC-like DNA-binding protein